MTFIIEILTFYDIQPNFTAKTKVKYVSNKD